MSSRSLLAVAALGLSVGACSTTKYRGAVVTPAALAGIGAENPDYTLSVEVPGRATAAGAASSTELPELARLVDVAPDHTTLALSSEAAARVVSNDSVKRIIVIRRDVGAAAGAGIGVMLGVAAALAVAATYSDPCANSTSWGCVGIPRADVSILTGLVVGIPAALIGAGLGAAIGDRTNYTFGPPEAGRVN
jgi:hypothetical protein